jgi:adenylate cyclase
MMKKRWTRHLDRPIVNTLLMGSVVSLLTAGMWFVGAWEPLEYLGYNLLFKTRHTSGLFPTDWDQRIAVIAIDEASLNVYGRFQSWNRDRYLQLLQILAPAPPKAIGLDLIFSEPSSVDKALAQEIELSGNVVLAVGIDANQKPLNVVPDLSAVARLGHIITRSDGDGISRQISLYIGKFPSFSLALVNAYNQTLAETFQSQQADKIKSLISLPKPASLEQEQAVWINWPGPVKELPTYSFVKVLQGKLEPQTFRNKIVLVGVTATALDPLRSPFDQNPPTSGVYLQAAVVDNLLKQRPLQRLPSHLTVLLLLALTPLTIFLLHHRHWQGRLVMLLLLLLSWWIVAFVSFSIIQWWIPTAAPIGTILLAAVGIQVREQQEKQQLMSLFSRHVAPEMARVIWQRKAEIFADGQLDPQELTATVLFMDIRGFTTVSEQLPPRELLNWLNLYLDAMTRCLMKHGGVVDKYIGDAIMAVFGVPFPRNQTEEIRQEALNALAASFAMYGCIDRLNQQLKAEGKPLIKVGIGIHTGPVIVGSVGGIQRLDYSVIGDTVNVASRLEAMNKAIVSERPYQILVSSSTFDYVSDRYLGQEVGIFRLRGKEIETKVYSILGPKRR